MARSLLAAAEPMIERKGLTLIGVTVTNLDPAHAGVQLALPSHPSGSALDSAPDELRDRFGPSVVTRATAAREPGLSAYSLPGD